MILMVNEYRKESITRNGQDYPRFDNSGNQFLTISPETGKPIYADMHTTKDKVRDNMPSWWPATDNAGGF